MTKNIAISLLFSVATVVLLGYIWFGQTAQRLEATGLRQEAQQIEFGQRNYEQYCASCHGLAGEGAGPVFSAPALNNLQQIKGPGTQGYEADNGVLAKYGSLRNYIEFTIAYGIRGTQMPAWKAQGMRDDQVEAIAAYVMSMQGGAVTEAALDTANTWKQTEIANQPPTPTPEVSFDTEEQRVGYDAFNLYCASCHSTSTEPLVGPGLAGLFGPEGTVAYGTVLPNGKEVNEANVAEWIRVGGGGEGGPDAQDAPPGLEEYPAMPAMEGVVNDDQIAAIIEYLKLLERE